MSSSTEKTGFDSKGSGEFKPDRQSALFSCNVSGPEGIFVYGKVSVELKGYKGKYGFYDSGIVVTLREEITGAQKKKRIRHFEVKTDPGGCFNIVRPISAPRPKISYTIERFKISEAGLSIPAGNFTPIGLGEKDRKRKSVLFFIGHRSFEVLPRTLKPRLILPGLLMNMSMQESVVSCVLKHISPKSKWYTMLDRELEQLRTTSRIANFEQKRKFKEAHALLTEYARENPGVIDEQSLRATLYIRQLNSLIEADRMIEAISILEDATHKITDQKEGKSLWWQAKKIASDFYKKKDYNNSIVILTYAISLNSSLEDPYIGRAKAWYRKGDYERSVLDLTRVIELNPKNFKAYYYRALASESLGQYAQAVSDFTRLIELKPENAKGYNGLAWLLATCSNDQFRNGGRAIELAQKAVKLKANSNFLDTLAAAYAEDGKYLEAVSTQKRAIALKEKEGNSEHLAELKERLAFYEAGKPWRVK